MAISFQFQASVFLSMRKPLKKFIQSMFNEHFLSTGSISIIFCSDKFLLEINRRFLNHDYLTDIITFDLSENRKKNIDAEIYISKDRIAENARRYGVSKNLELHRVIFHGILHLCGYKDKTPAQKLQMRKLEDHYLKMYNHNSST